MSGSKIISEGDKIEFTDILSPDDLMEGKKSNKYVSQVFDFTENGNIKVAMPILRGRLIPLTKGAKYEAFFYTSRGLFQCRALVVDRYKSGNIYTVEIELKSELQKYQRRQYYRLEKAIPIKYSQLSEINYVKMIKTRKFPEEMMDSSIYENGMSADISGGGMRFVGNKKIEKDDKVLIVFDVSSENVQTQFHLPASVILSFELPNRVNFFEHRVEFENISKEYREILIRYIFEEERKQRKNTR